jgi:hypothetical protein
VKTFKFHTVTPLFTEDLDFVVSNVRRLRRETGLNCIAFSLSMHPQGTPAAARAAKTIEAFRKVKQALTADSDLEIGVLVQSTLGHGWSGRWQLTAEPWQRIVMQDGSVSSRMCPSDARFRNYVLDVIAGIAAADPAFLLIDDDFGLRNGECFCPAHLAELNGAVGTRFASPAEAHAALAAGGKGDPLLWTYESLRIDLSRLFAREIRQTIDRVDPSIRCGYCTPYMGFMFAEEIAMLLAGGTEPFVRVANAYYLSTSTQALPELAGVTAKGRSAVSRIREMIDESDTFPHTRFSESATALHAHLASAILDGLSGSKLCISDFTRPNPAGCREYERIVADNRRFCDALYTAGRHEEAAALADKLDPVFYDHVDWLLWNKIKWMSHKGTLPVRSDRTAFENCLAAVEHCDLFLGIITPHYGSGQDKKNPNGLSITHQEVQKAIELKKPRWLLAHEHVVFAWSLLKSLGHKDKVSRGKLNADFKGTPALDDLRVLDLYEEAIVNELPLSERNGNWVQKYRSIDDGSLFVASQFFRYQEVEQFIKENFERGTPLPRKGGEA